eukprot:2537744-Prymnesium_polylepis.1
MAAEAVPVGRRWVGAEHGCDRRGGRLLQRQSIHPSQRAQPPVGVDAPVDAAGASKAAKLGRRTASAAVALGKLVRGVGADLGGWFLSLGQRHLPSRGAEPVHGVHALAVDRVEEHGSTHGEGFLAGVPEASAGAMSQENGDGVVLSQAVWGHPRQICKNDISGVRGSKQIVYQIHPKFSGQQRLS